MKFWGSVNARLSYIPQKKLFSGFATVLVDNNKSVLFDSFPSLVSQSCNHFKHTFKLDEQYKNAIVKTRSLNSVTNEVH